MKIAQHQNGFLKVELPLGGRLHVWSPWNPPVFGQDAPVHDHPFHFESFVAGGEMIDVRLRAEVADDGSWIEQSAACVTSFGPQPDLVPTGRRVRLVEERTTVLPRGTFYHMRPWELHRTDAVLCATIFRKGAQEEGHSTVYAQSVHFDPRPFRPAHEHVCRAALDRALAAMRLDLDGVVALEASLVARGKVYSRAEALLAGLPAAQAPGYHLREFPRFTHGEAGKVLEEAMELAEAAEQGVRIMQLCEMADVVSAIRGLLGAEFPDFSLADVVAMSEATDRAFAAGRRI